MTARLPPLSREQALIDAMRGAVPCPPAPAGPGDDAAVLDADAHVVTTDLMVEGTHFLRAHPPRWLGWKLLAVNLSDVAAMGARPGAFTLTAALPADTPAEWWEALASGVGDLARAWGARLVGGDVVASPGPVMLGVTAWGQLPGPPLRRNGGRAGDRLMVFGAVGRSAEGCRQWLGRATGDWGSDPTDALDDPCLRAHLRPCPDLSVGPWAVAHGATAGLDLSDGLAVDLARLATASGVALAVDLDRLPADPACGHLPPEVRAAGGEDYGLATLVRPDQAPRFLERGFTDLGSATASAAAPVIWTRAGREVDVEPLAFRHFE